MKQKLTNPVTADHAHIIDLENTVVQGLLNCSSATGTPTASQRHFEPMGGITHTHSVLATARVQMPLAIVCLSTTFVCGNVPYGPSVSQQTA